MERERIAHGLDVVRQLSDDRSWKTASGVRPTIGGCREALEALDDAIAPVSSYGQRWRERLRVLLDAVAHEGEAGRPPDADAALDAWEDGTWDEVPADVATAARDCLAPLPVPSPPQPLPAPRRHAGAAELEALQRHLEELAAAPGVRGVLLMNRRGDLVAAAGELDPAHDDPADVAVPVTRSLALVLLAQPAESARRRVALGHAAAALGALLSPFET